MQYKKVNKVVKKFNKRICKPYNKEKKMAMEEQNKVNKLI